MATKTKNYKLLIMYKFGTRSKEKLSSCHIDLQILAYEAIKSSPYDFGITHGHRTADEQNKLYQKGRDKEGRIINKGAVVTYVDGFIKKSKHNAYLSDAFDIACYLDGIITWEPSVYLEVGTHIMEVSEKLFENDLIENRISWGGHWHKFKDWPHFQI